MAQRTNHINTGVSDASKKKKPDADKSPGPGRPSKRPITEIEVKAALQVMGITIRLNKISGDIEFSGVDEKYSRENLSSVVPLLILDKFKLSSLFQRPNINDLQAYMSMIADENRYSPVEEMLRTTKADKEDRVKILCEILGIQDNPKSMLYVKKWLHQCVALALNDDKQPYSADGCLTLQGDQGIGKTSFFRSIAVNPEWFNEGVTLDLANKDTTIPAVSRWITELGELDSTLRREQTALKAFLTQQEDNHRKPYARAWVRRPRRTSFCATVNDETFLRDPTGSRRFWVVHVDHIDLEKLRGLQPVWFMKMWRQVYLEIYKPNPQGFRLTSEERENLQTDNMALYTVTSREYENALDQMNFSAPLEKWEMLTVKEIKARYFLSWLSISQLGRLLSQASQMDRRIKHSRAQNKSRYLVPPPKVGGSMVYTPIISSTSEQAADKPNDADAG